MKLQNLKFRLLLFIISLSFFSFSQNEYVDYRSATNPLYWKNRKPFEGYWQQDVHYKIIADVNDSTDILTGKEELTYWNNSPYDISFVYFHLYSNAQTKNSYCADLYKNNNYNLKFGKYRSKDLGTVVEKITLDNQELKTELAQLIKEVQASNDVATIKKLEQELRRIQKLGGFEAIVPTEGIVFVYGGHTYKLTGAFAPVNQLLGVLKYTR